VKVYLSFDFEGVAGIVDWAQCREGEPAYDQGCHLTLCEVNAAICGAVDAGADEIVVNDSHSTMRNLNPEELDHRAMYVSGRHKQMYMMQDLDSSYDVIFLVGYHGSISGDASTLSHTYNPEVFSAAHVNGIEVGESGINALVADHYGIPIGLITGDEATQTQTAPFAVNGVRVITKYSQSRFGAKSLHPAESRELIQSGAEQAVRRAAADGLREPGLERPVRLELQVQTADMAEIGSWVKGAERAGPRTIQIESNDLLSVYRSFVSVNYITRQAGGR
jgi:D-amino peptidase